MRELCKKKSGYSDIQSMGAFKCIKVCLGAPCFCRETNVSVFIIYKRYVK